ncbi:MAG: VOC family protein [Nonomuraea sp.]|nr:VOC family protein [Nonomuraea sp.]
MSDILSIDHTVLYTTDLETTAATYEALGFTLSPLSLHVGPDGPMGAGNRCALFGGNYLELLGLFGEEDPWQVKPLIATHEGLHGYSFGCADPAAVERRLRAAGLSSSGVLPLQRDVRGGTARFQAVHFERSRTPEGLVHVAHHLTPHLIHQPGYLTHPNGALRLDGVLLVVDDGELEATVARYAAMLDVEPARLMHLPLGWVEIVPESEFAGLLPGEEIPALPYMAAQCVAVDDLAVARALVEGGGFRTRDLPGGFFVGAAQARGAALTFVEA